MSFPGEGDVVSLPGEGPRLRGSTARRIDGRHRRLGHKIYRNGSEVPRLRGPTAKRTTPATDGLAVHLPLQFGGGPTQWGSTASEWRQVARALAFPVHDRAEALA